MEKRRKLTPEQRARLRVAIEELRDEVRDLAGRLQYRLDELEEHEQRRRRRLRRLSLGVLGAWGGKGDRSVPGGTIAE